ncbi:protein-methionine-sulfoxide reductase heme-binding subunit MsrQ [Thioclava sp. NG1]|uniref:protein-methionine-sulfoxide reductase heme-binding subunit MsrQ n=1 Tax=unclassified Thioclava TaxID=2621713 RepID=UPI000B54622F|nr:MULTISPECIES: protein-methionine-sulfoxide reductase heme-binding subunit MsrQ [unclassified Thioclava]OWY02477.1 sulfoxide reductase heme-binding subunit YedZ [Thioclava sp. F1Mire-8]OWY12913.1 sulfoxide reductase heme-binding subunit YedZ [Thioclava sp. F34-6]PWE49917.1 protein-methionine-sulfoxide reductase heme-binding subunit MsrQ [Thioclava sp. NG1]
MNSATLSAPINTALRRVPSWLVYLAGLIPLAWVVWLTLTGGIGVDPVKGIEHRLGKIALWFLIGGLAITPARRFLGLNLIKYRRAIGLLAFFYVALHLIAWAVLDMGMLWGQAARDLIKRPYLFFGISAFVLLIPLAITSNNASVRKLGKTWRRIHMLVYPAVALGVIHYLWQMKVISNEGWLWLGVFAVLMAVRFRSFRW